MNSPIVSQLSIYPIKSTAGIDVSHAWLDDKGLNFDRRFVISTPEGQFITARTEPSICLIQSFLKPTGLVLTAPKMEPLTIEYAEFSNEYQDVTVWADTISGQISHDKYHQWFSEYLGKPCRLLFFGEQSNRLVKNTDNQVGFADGYPVLLISQASLDNLNHRLKFSGADAISMKQFRPNIVVENTAAFAEDGWKLIKIGDVLFEVAKPCSRCIFTTVDPKTATKHQDKEPLSTLKEYRQGEDKDIYFGQNLIPLSEGQIKQGDTVKVLSRQPAVVYFDQNPLAKPAEKAEDNTLALECVKVIDETHDVKTFVFKSKTGTPNYIAGQHLPISLEIDGKSVKRLYTLSSSPDHNEHLQITVKRLDNGRATPFIHNNIQVGTALDAELPKGDFHHQKITKDKIALISAGSGMTPMLSMLKTLAKSQRASDIYYWHLAKTESDIIAEALVNELAEQHGNCQVTYSLTRDIITSHRTGYFDEAFFSQFDDLTERQFMICGPEGFRNSVITFLTDLGVNKNDISFESFGIRKQPKNASQEQAMPKKVSIFFDSWNKQVEGNDQETILQQGENAGLIMPYSCLAGNCGACRVKLQSGEVKQLATDGLMPDQQADGYVLACSCIPQSDIVVTKD